MQEQIEQAKAEFLRAKDRLVNVLATTPDDRVAWSPSPTARSPLHLAAHAAAAIQNLHYMMDSRPFAVPTMAEADKIFLDWERQFQTRDQVLEVVEKNSADYLAWLDGLTPERYNTLVELPFGMGSAPVSLVLTFIPLHTQSHIAQIEYIQTIYGDRDWR